MSERVLDGTDGFRGPVELDQSGPARINYETAAFLSLATVMTQHEQGGRGAFIVGGDTRASTYELKSGAIGGARIASDFVVDMGVVPTPAIQKMTVELEGIGAMSVTASHNPEGDNGLKYLPDGRKPSDEQAQNISHKYWELVRGNVDVPKHPEPKVDRWGDMLKSEYGRQVLADVRKTFERVRPLANKLVVVDGAYGAGKEFTPQILRSLGAKVIEYACDDGGRINEHCGAADLRGLKEFLADRPSITDHPGFIGGLANDGDADRLMAVGVVPGKSGSRKLVELTGNHIMWAMAHNEPGIVGTEYTNSGLVTRLQQDGIEFEYCANGDVHVTRRLLQLQQEGKPWHIGGEFSGHLVDTDWLSSGDGVRMAAWLACWATSRDMTLGDMHQELPLWPEHMESVQLPAGIKIAKTDERLLAAKAEAEASLAGAGRVVVLPSGTQPVVRAWVEATEAALGAEVSAKLVHNLQHTLAT